MTDCQCCQCPERAHRAADMPHLWHLHINAPSSRAARWHARAPRVRAEYHRRRRARRSGRR